MVSMQSAISSLETSEYFMPSIPMDSPSVTTGVPKTNGLPPAFPTSFFISLPNFSI